MASSVEAAGPCRAKTCCFRRRLAGTAHSSSTSNLQSVPQICQNMHAGYKNVSAAESDTQPDCHASAGVRGHHLPSLFGPCQQLRAMRTRVLARRSAGPLCAGTHSSGTVLSTQRSSFLYIADFSSPDFSVKNIDCLLMGSTHNIIVAHSARPAKHQQIVA